MRENALLQHVYRSNDALPPFVTIPPGDDMAGLRLAGPDLLVAVDQVADQLHFDLAHTPLELVGRKALTRNLSDIAAMAAQPTAAVVAVCLPQDFGHSRATALFDALRKTAEEFACPLVGGDISIWPGRLLLSVTVLAQPWPDASPIRRTGAQPGDQLVVTGHLGGSFPTGHHLTFTPRLDAAHQLAASPTLRPTAMIDLSDGIAQDLPRLVPHAVVQAADLPLRPGLPDSNDDPAWTHALGDGEDYELLMAIPAAADLPEHIAGVPLTRIGHVAEHAGHRVITPAGQSLPLADAAHGWEHGR